MNDCIAISAHTESRFRIYVYKVNTNQLSLSHAQTFDIDGEVTCIALGVDYTILAGIRRGSQILLGHAFLQQPSDGLDLIDLTQRKPLPVTYCCPQLCSAWITADLRRCVRAG